MNTRIESVRAMQIYDSRGLPTVRVKIELNNGMIAAASLPSGASTGENDAVEQRAGDAKAHGGKGVLKAVAHVTDIIAPAVTGIEPWRQAEIDHRMITWTARRTRPT
jgi:enolase